MTAYVDLRDVIWEAWEQSALAELPDGKSFQITDLWREQP